MKALEYKGYKIETGELATMKKIVSIGSGALPKDLRGLYTSVEAARRSIDIHLSSKGVTKGGKTE
jgi:hypothetical protein